MNWSGPNKEFKREDGVVSQNERAWSFQSFMSNVIPAGILLLLAWLLKVNSDNGALLATLVERTGNQTRAIEAERDDRLTADRFLQGEIERMNAKETR